MGALAISGKDKEGRHYLEILAGYLVNGELLSDYEYALRSQPLTDNTIPEQKGLPPYRGPNFWPLECEYCGEWAGDLILPHGMAEPEMIAAAAAHKDRLCPRHWNDRKWARLPGQRNYRGK